MDIVLPKDVKLPWYLLPMAEREPRMWNQHEPWRCAEWQRYTIEQPFGCPYDGSILAIDTITAYYGGSPEPVYVAWCRICSSEFDI